MRPLNGVVGAVLRFAAANLAARAENARNSMKVRLQSGPLDDVTRLQGEAHAFTVGADYLRALADGYEKRPTMRTIVAQYGSPS